MKRVMIVSLALIMGLSAVAFADGIGAFSAFKNGVGARALAMGGAFVAVCDDTTAMVWNPAGLAQIDDTRLAGMSTNLYALDITRQFVGATTNFANLGIGLGWEGTSITGVGSTAAGVETSEFTLSENAITGSLATTVMDVVTAGASVKYYTAKNGADDNSGTGFGFDLGLLFNLGDTFTLGISAKDITGSTFTWDTTEVSTISALYKAGMAVKLADDKLVLAADVDFNEDVALGNTHVGIEFQVIDELAVRGGVVMASDFQDYTLSVGAGINVAGLYVDAAYILPSNTAEAYAESTLVLSAEFSLGGLLGEDEPVEEVGTE